MKSPQEKDPSLAESPGFSARDLGLMRRALVLARRGGATVYPNPQVGALLVSGGRVIGQGWHQVAGGAHAEILAIRSASESVASIESLKAKFKGVELKGAELFVTLEPCNHTGRTGPCVEAIIAAGISRVVIAMRDPNPRVTGGGIERLQQAGIEVCCGCLAAEARYLNRAWTHSMETGRARVTGLLCLSLNGLVLNEEVLPPPVKQIFMRVRSNFPYRFFDSKLHGADSQLSESEITRAPANLFCPDSLMLLREKQIFGVLVEDLTALRELLGQASVDALVVVQAPAFAANSEVSRDYLVGSGFRLQRTSLYRQIPISVYERNSV